MHALGVVGHEAGVLFGVESFDAFVAYLRNEGLTVNVGRNITLQTEEMPFALRSGQLGENYSISAIKKRLDAILSDENADFVKIAEKYAFHKSTAQKAKSLLKRAVRKIIK